MIEGLADRLKDSRKNNGLSQRKAASMVGISYATLAAYETGSRTPSPLVLCKLANLYHCSTDFLLGMKASSDMVLDHNGLTTEQIALVQNLIKDMKRK